MEKSESDQDQFLGIETFENDSNEGENQIDPKKMNQEEEEKPSKPLKSTKTTTNKAINSGI